MSSWLINDLHRASCTTSDWDPLSSVALFSPLTTLLTFTSPRRKKRKRVDPVLDDCAKMIIEEATDYGFPGFHFVAEAYNQPSGYLMGARLLMAVMAAVTNRGGFIVDKAFASDAFS